MKNIRNDITTGHTNTTSHNGETAAAIEIMSNLLFDP
jgi:hypothetical protein